MRRPTKPVIRKYWYAYRCWPSSFAGARQNCWRRIGEVSQWARKISPMKNANRAGGRSMIPCLCRRTEMVIFTWMTMRMNRCTRRARCDKFGYRHRVLVYVSPQQRKSLSDLPHRTVWIQRPGGEERAGLKGFDSPKHNQEVIQCFREYLQKQ